MSHQQHLRGVTALTRAVSGEKQIYSGNLEILPGIGKPGKFFGKYKIFSGHWAKIWYLYMLSNNIYAPCVCAVFSVFYVFWHLKTAGLPMIWKDQSATFPTKGRTIRKLMGGGRSTKKYSRKAKLNEKNSCTPINPKKYSCYGLKKIHTRNLITKKNSCCSKIPLPPRHNFSNGPSLKYLEVGHSTTAWCTFGTI